MRPLRIRDTDFAHYPLWGRRFRLPVRPLSGDL